jgi:hypothetical protein
MLAVKKDSTAARKDADFNIVTHHLFCQGCGKDVDIKYAQMIGDVSDFIDRGRAKKNRPKPFYVIAETESRAISLYQKLAKDQLYKRAHKPESFYGIDGLGECVYITKTAHESPEYSDVIMAALERGFKMNAVDD